MTEDFRKRFQELKTAGQRGAANGKQLLKNDTELVSFLQNAFSDGTLKTFEEKGFALWNISANPAAMYKISEQDIAL